MKISNPMFSSIEQTTTENRATFRGITNKTGFLLALTFLTALFFMITGYFSYPLLIVSTVVGFIAVIMGRMNPRMAMTCGIIYGVCEGMFLGLIAAMIGLIPGYEAVVPIAILATLSIFTTMLVLYSTKVVAATPRLYKVLSTAGSAMLLFILLAFVLSLFGNNVIMEMMYGNTTMGVLFAVLFIAYGSFMLVLNFDEAQSYVENGFDKSFEWVAALGLMITVIYIYIQVLRFVLLIMQKRD